MRKGKRVDLRMNGFANTLITVAETGDRSPSGTVEVAIAGGVDEIDPVTRNGERELSVQTVAVSA